MPLFIPSPEHGVLYLGPIPIRGYSISILIGIIIAFVLSRKRWKSTGGDPEHFENLLFISILMGIIGARIYWVIIEWPRYFGTGGTWYHIFFVWQGGLGIWGGITLGFVTALILCRRFTMPFLKVADCVAPGFLIAQGIGRLGNWWNQELYGLPTELPWALEIDRSHRVAGFEQYATFHPTFLYEMLWNFAGATVLLLVSRKLRIGSGLIFGLYVIIYALGRFWIELFRIDPVHVIAGMRINSWTTLLAGLIGVVVFIWALKRRAGTMDSDSEDTDTSDPSVDHRSDEDSLGEITG